MLHLSDKIRYFIYPLVADMRKGFNGLCGLVINEVGTKPDNGDAYIFFSKDRSQIKILLWAGDGFALYYKKLQAGTFEVPPCHADGSGVYVDDSTLLHIIKGVTLQTGKFRRRFTGVASAPSGMGITSTP